MKEPIIIAIYLMATLIGPAAQTQLIELNPQISSAEILLIGDSHTYGVFGRSLEAKLRTRPEMVEVIGSCGSSASSWMKTIGHTSTCGARISNSKSEEFDSCKMKLGQTLCAPAHFLNFNSILQEVQPTTVIIALGTNMLPDIRAGEIEAVLASVKKMTDAVQTYHASCIWIGPPQASLQIISEDSYRQFVNSLNDTVTKSNCTFINSDSPKTDRQNIHDRLGLHYTVSPWPENWAAAVYQEVLIK